MATEIKFCGLTRPEDAAMAVALRAAYVGVIFAGGPRHLTIERATEVLADVPREVSRVGVFADQSAGDIARAAAQLQLDVVQLHGASGPERVDAIRRGFHGRVWPVCRVSGTSLPPNTLESLAAGDGLLVDALAPGALGGTGITLPWAAIAPDIAAIRQQTKPTKLFILAGGLRPENVAAAISTLSPDVVDVSSGVERAPGIKDHERMRAFRDAVDASYLT